MRTMICMAIGIAVGGAADARTVFDGTDRLRACYAAAATDESDASRAIRRGIRACTAALTIPVGPTTHAAVLVNRGIVRMRGGALDAAIADYDAALALVPSLPEALVNKGVAFRRAGRAREAVELLTAAIAGGPSRPEIAYYQRGIANEAIGATRDAYHDYVEARALAPDWTSPAEELKRFSVVRRRTAAG